MCLKGASKVSSIKMYFPLLIQIAQSTLEIHYNLHKYFTYIVFCAVRRNCSCLFLDPKQACSILLSIIRKLDSQTKNKNRRRSSQLPKSFQGIRWGTWPQFLSLAISTMEIKLSISLLPYLSTWNTVSSQHNTAHLFLNISTILIGFPGASVVKNLPAVQRQSSLGEEDLLE